MNRSAATGTPFSCFLLGYSAAFQRSEIPIGLLLLTLLSCDRKDFPNITLVSRPRKCRANFAEVDSAIEKSKLLQATGEMYAYDPTERSDPPPVRVTPQEREAANLAR